MKIYVASSWRNAWQPEVVKELRDAGHEVYDFRNPPNGSGGFAWSDIDKEWEDWTTEEYFNALQHPIADEGFNSDFDGMKWADACVMVLPCGRSANTEAGWMKGNGKMCFVYSPIKQEPELMYKIYDGVFGDLPEMINALSALVDFGPPDKPVGGLRWVKASEQLPKPGLIHYKEKGGLNDVLIYSSKHGFFKPIPKKIGDKRNTELRLIKTPLDEIFWLDESHESPSPLTSEDIRQMAEERYPIIDRQTFLKGSNSSYPDYVSVLNSKRLAFIAGAKAIAGAGATGKVSDAIEFVNWITKCQTWMVKDSDEGTWWNI